MLLLLLLFTIACLDGMQAFTSYLPRLGGVVFETAFVVQGNRQVAEELLLYL